MDEFSDDDRRNNLCADVVSLTRLEPGLACLFRQPSGTWVAVEELYRLSEQVGVAVAEGGEVLAGVPPVGDEPHERRRDGFVIAGELRACRVIPGAVRAATQRRAGLEGGVQLLDAAPHRVPCGPVRRTAT